MKIYKHYILYKITNLINGKIYIGKHKCDRLDDTYFGSGKLLKYAINKYGKENFIFELLIDLHNEHEMDLLEEMVVNKDFLARPDVYNISKGGQNPCMYGNKNPFYGKTHSDEFKLNTSKRFKNKHITKEHKQHISEGYKKLLNEHPEIRLKLATRKNKKQCINKITSEIKFFKEDCIPDNFEIYRKPIVSKKISEEEKLKLKKKDPKKINDQNGLIMV